MKDFQPTHIRLNDLPVVITGVGEYKTRGGDCVFIHEVLDDPKDGCTRFLAKGDIYRTNKIGHKRTFMYSIWHVSGRFRVLGESRHDIVEKV